MDKLQMNRKQRRQAGEEITKADLERAYQKGFNVGSVKGYYKGIEKAGLDAEKVLADDFGFGSKRLDRFNQGLLKILRLKKEAE